jgi:hypothetical protein
MKEAESRTYTSVLQHSRGTMCAECHSAVVSESSVVKEVLGYDYRYVHPACYRSIPCINLIHPIITSIGDDLQALSANYERHVAALLPIPANQFYKRCNFAHIPRERILLETLKFLSIPDKLIVGKVCKVWYESVWNEELWPSSPSPVASLRLAALQNYLNLCKACGRELTMNSVFIVVEHRRRGYCKACYNDGLRPISLKVIQICLGLSQQFLTDLQLPIIANIGTQAYTLLQSVKNRLYAHVKALLAPICLLIKQNHYKEATRAVTELKKNVFVRVVPALIKDVFPQGLVLEAAREGELQEEETEELIRLLQIA